MGDVCVHTLTGERLPLPEASVQAWQRCLRGPLLRPGDDGYEDARQVWNGMIDRKPAFIVRCAAEDAAAFEYRHAHHALNISGVWSDPQATDAHLRWTRAFWEAMRPFSTGRVYVNFLGDEGEDRVRAAYGAAKYARLVALKNAYDPTNMFRLNQNIAPTA